MLLRIRRRFGILVRRKTGEQSSHQQATSSMSREEMYRGLVLDGQAQVEGN